MHAHRAVRHAQLRQADALDGEGRAVRLSAALPWFAAEEQELVVELEPIGRHTHTVVAEQTVFGGTVTLPVIPA